MSAATKEKAGGQLGDFSATEQKHEANNTAITDEVKPFSTLQAKFAIAGHVLCKTINPDGSILYLASRWGFVRELKSLEAVAAFLAMIGGVK
jgi:hypothetical protein